jgi:hypothetical protein
MEAHRVFRKISFPLSVILCVFFLILLISEAASLLEADTTRQGVKAMMDRCFGCHGKQSHRSLRSLVHPYLIRYGTPDYDVVAKRLDLALRDVVGVSRSLPQSAEHLLIHAECD